jgi:hypothetical protein
MTATSGALDQALRSLRTLYLVFMVTVLLYVYMMHIVHGSPQSIYAPMFWSIAGVAGFCYLSACSLRMRKLQPEIGRLRVAPDDASVLGRWRSWSIVGLTMLECVVLFGFALHMLGASTIQIAPFIVVPFLTMLAWFPRRP